MGDFINEVRVGPDPSELFVKVAEGREVILDNSYLIRKMLEYHTVYIRSGYPVIRVALRHMRGACSFANEWSTRVYLHNLVKGSPPSGLVVDHRNRNRLDNRQSNLRVVTYRVNALNHGIVRNSSGATGVCRNRQRKLWVASWGTDAGPKKYATFRDATYGGRDEAFAAAVERREEAISKIRVYQMADPEAPEVPIEEARRLVKRKRTTVVDKYTYT